MFYPVPFGEWLPDLPPHQNPGALEARNVIPESLSYRPFRNGTVFTDALAARVLAAFWAQDDSNTIFNFAGDAGDLYQLSGAGVWNVVSKAGGYVATDWEFAKFGQRIIATHDGDLPQYFDMGVSALFADLPGAPPIASRVGIVRDFVVLGDLQNEPSRIQWSGFNNSDIWTGIQFQSDFQELFGRGGRVQKIVGGAVGVVFLENSIFLMQYVGPPTIFRIDEVETGRGTPAPGSVVRTGDTIFYLSHDGFYKFEGGRSTPIGHNRVNQWFEANSNPSSLEYMKAAVDRRNRLVMWAFSSVGSTTVNDRVLIYNWGSDRWSNAVIDTECLADLTSVGFNLDTLDTILTNGIDIDSIPVDSSAYQGGALNFVGFNASHQAVTFTGSPLVAEIDTQEISDGLLQGGMPGGRRLFTSNVRPMVTGGPPTSLGVRVGHRNRLYENSTLDAEVAVNGAGEANVRRDGRYQRMRVVIDGEFEHAQGCEVETQPTGRR